MKLYILLYFLFNLLFGKNFIYNEDSWYNITSLKSITSISNNYNEIYFSSLNGLFIYDKNHKNITYASQVLNNVDNKNIYIVYYDSYRDKIWLLNKDKILYKSSIGNAWGNIYFSNLNVNSYRDIVNIGSNINYIILQLRNRFVLIDPFTGIVAKNKSDEEINIELLTANWSSSYRSRLDNQIDLSNYYSNNEWEIISENKIKKGNRTIYVTCMHEDNGGYKWIGTETGELFYVSSFNKNIEEIKSIPPIRNINFSYVDSLNHWWIADNDWKFNYSEIIYDQEIIFLCHWDEKNNLWTRYFQKEYPHILSKDINDIYRNENFLYIATIHGLLIFDIINEKWELIDVSNALSNNHIYKLDPKGNILYLSTLKGISSLSMEINQIIPNHFYDIKHLKVYDMLILKNKYYVLSDVGLLLFNNDRSQVISNKKFKNIELYNGEIILSERDNIYKLIEDKKIDILLQYHNIQNFDICGNHIWMHNKNSAMIYNLNNNYKLKYDASDGILGNIIYNVECNENWVWFNTNNGLSFYNWKQFHNEK